MRSIAHVSILLILLGASSARAAVTEYVREYTYHGATFDTESTCRTNAIEGVKRELLDELGTYVSSVVEIHQDSLGNSHMSQDVINITAGIVAMKVLEERWRRPAFFVRAGMKADPDDVLVKLKVLRADLELENALRDSNEALEQARRELASLKAQLQRLQAEAMPASPAASEVPAISEVPLTLPESLPAAVSDSTPVATTSAPVAVTEPPPAAETSPPASASEPPSVALAEPSSNLPAAALALPEVPSPAVVAEVPDAATAQELVVQYQDAIKDVVVGEAFQRALAARLNGDFDSLFSEMNKLAEQGYAKAQFRLGWLYERGVGVRQDYAKAREWYERAMQNGDDFALARMGLLYELGLGVEKDYATAREYYSRALRAENALGYAQMGYLYETGKGVEMDRLKAAELYRTAMEKGNYLAMTRLGFLYQQGRGVERDDYKAVQLYQQAVDHGQPLAMTRLGQMYNLGRGGLTRDHQRAMGLIRESMRYKLPAAFAFMGFMYENGWAVEQDYAQARMLYEKAAALDAPFAELRLGILYKEGRGVARSRDKALYWLDRAAGKGEERAAEISSRMRRGRE